MGNCHPRFKGEGTGVILIHGACRRHESSDSCRPPDSILALADSFSSQTAFPKEVGSKDSIYIIEAPQSQLSNIHQ